MIPVKSFGDAKRRLSPRLDSDQRRRLGRALATRTAWIAHDAGASVVIVAGTEEVATWAANSGFASITQSDGHPGLDGGARLGMEAAAAAGARGFVIHADLPCVTQAVLRRAFSIEGAVIAPAHDGGTALLGGVGPGFRFAYGPGSFHRHLAAAPDAAVLSVPELAFDVDRPHDLERARSYGTARWLDGYAPAVHQTGKD